MVQRTKKNLKSFYEKEAKSLPSHQELMYLKGDKHELWWHRKRLGYIIYFLSEIFRKNEVITFVDVGCAEGYYVKIVAEAQRKTFCVGTDIARTYIKKAKKNCNVANVDYVVCDIENLPFKSESVNVVVCSEVLEHVLNYKSAILELFRIGKKHLIISFPGHTCIYEVIRKIKPLKEFAEKLVADVGHISEVRIEDLKKILGGRFASFEVKIAGALPLILVKMFPSIRFVDVIDEIICKVLRRFNALEYVTIHVVKVVK